MYEVRVVSPEKKELLLIKILLSACKDIVHGGYLLLGSMR